MNNNFRFKSEHMPAIANDRDYQLAEDFRNVRKYIQGLENRIQELEKKFEEKIPLEMMDD